MPLLGSLAAGSVKGFGAQANLGYFIGQSLRFRGAQTLSRTFTTPTNNKIFTYSAWVKRGKLNQYDFLLRGNEASSTSMILFEDQSITVQLGNGTTATYIKTTALYRDPAAWYHIVAAIDTTQATASNRIKLYVNGTQVTSFLTENYPTQNFNPSMNSAILHTIGNNYAASVYFDGYMGDVYFVDGQQLTPSDFGKTDPSTGQWIPKKYAGTYGTNGFKLDFKHQTSASGFNTVTYTGNGSSTGHSIDGVGFSPDLIWIKNRTTSANNVLYDTVRGVNNRIYSSATSAENINTSDTLSAFNSDGFTVKSAGAGSWVNDSANNYVAWCWDATSDNTTGSELVTNGTFDTNTTGWTNVNCSYSVSNGKLSATYTSAGAYVWQAVSGLTIGQKYVYSAQSSGANDFMKVTTVSQTGSEVTYLGGYSITRSGLNQLFFEASTTTVYVRFDVPNGQTITIDDVSLKQVSYGGTIPSYTKTNTSTGFSIVTYTGTGSAGTIGHGLSSDPNMIIVKKRNAIDNWVAYHSALSSPRDKYLLLSATNAEATLSNYWGTSAWTSGVFGTNSYGGINSSNDQFVAYCFSEVSGYSKFGSYTGNGSTSGPTVTTGFRPAFVMIKRTDTVDNWHICDNTRSPDGTFNDVLRANLTNAESANNTAFNITYSDTGFTLANTNSELNASGGTYIYMAFADTRDTAFWRDKSGTNNHWTLNAINYAASTQTTYDLMNDVPTLTSMDKSNFATLNPLYKDSAFLSSTYSNGNLNMLSGGTASNGISSIGVNSGKYYWESVMTAIPTTTTLYVAVAGIPISSTTIRAYRYDTGQYFDGSNWISYGATYTTNDVIGVALDMDSNTIEFFKNGVSQGQKTSIGLSGQTIFPLIYANANGGVAVNFGQRPFKYTPPTGYKKLNTYNL